MNETAIKMSTQENEIVVEHSYCNFDSSTGKLRVMFDDACLDEPQFTKIEQFADLMGTGPQMFLVTELNIEEVVKREVEWFETYDAAKDESANDTEKAEEHKANILAMKAQLLVALEHIKDAGL